MIPIIDDLNETNTSCNIEVIKHGMSSDIAIFTASEFNDTIINTDTISSIGKVQIDPNEQSPHITNTKENDVLIVRNTYNVYVEFKYQQLRL